MASKIIVDQLEKTGGTLTPLTLPVANATVGQYMKNDGSGVLGWVDPPADVSGLTSVQIFTASATWTKPTDITKVIIEVQGGGGSGNREDSSDSNNCAGGAGGYAKKFLDVSSITSSVITVGSGGAAVSSSAGNDGGISSWNDSAGGGSLTITCNPGIGGNNTSYVGANGGTAVNGDINIQGGVGSYNFPAQAGGSILGNAGVSLLNSALTGGKGYGSGGGSGRSTTSGAGAPGIILIWEYA